MINKSYLTGCLCAMAGGLCYAIGGSCGQYLFMNNAMESGWLVTLRMCISGLILILISLLRGEHVFAPFRRRRDIISLFSFALIGTTLSQFGFYFSIQYSNVAFATVFAYSAAAMLLVYEVIRYRRKPQFAETVSVLMVMAGIFFMVTHGDISKLAVSYKAIIASIIGALGWACYSVQPVRLLKRYSLFLTVGWGLLIAGIVCALVYRPWHYEHIVYNSDLLIYMSGVIVVGTLLAFNLFLAGVERVGGVVSNVLSAVEPIFSFFICMAVLGVALTVDDVVGMLLVVSAIIILSVFKKAKVK